MQITQNLTKLKNEITETAQACGRDPNQIQLIAVTKSFPSSDLKILTELGITEIGESKDQEVVSKLAEIKSLQLNLHFIGQLQRNKLRSIASYSHAIHSVDRSEVIKKLAEIYINQQRSVPILLQVELAETKTLGRGGATVSGILELAALATSLNISVAGLMAIAPIGVEPDIAFAKFAEIAGDFASVYPAASWRSIGMSQDWQSAIKHGATHLRIGSLLLGNRG